MPIIYTVQSGDTLHNIAGMFGVTMPMLAYANNLNYPNIIYVGQKLNIPIEKNLQPINDGVPVYSSADPSYSYSS